MKKEICILTNMSHPLFSPESYNGGINKHTFDLIDCLCDNYNLTCVITKDSFKYKEDKVKYLVVDYTSSEGIYNENKKSNGIKRANAVKQIFSGRYFDLVISQNHQFNKSSYINLPYNIVNFIHHTADNPVSGDLSFSNMVFFTKMKSFLDTQGTYVFVSELQRQTFKSVAQKIFDRVSRVENLKSTYPLYNNCLSIPFEKTEVIHNPIEFDFDLDLSLADKIFDFVFTGRMHKEKKIEKILNFAKLNPSKTFRLFCIQVSGQEEYQEKILEKAKTLNNVSILFGVPYDKIMEQVKQAKALILMSNESLSYSGSEALYLGTKVLHFMQQKHISSPLQEFNILDGVMIIKDFKSVNTEDINNFLSTPILQSEIVKFRKYISKLNYQIKLTNLVEKYIL